MGSDGKHLAVGTRHANGSHGALLLYSLDVQQVHDEYGLAGLTLANDPAQCCMVRTYRVRCALAEVLNPMTPKVLILGRM